MNKPLSLRNINDYNNNGSYDHKSNNNIPNHNSNNNNDDNINIGIDLKTRIKKK